MHQVCEQVILPLFVRAVRAALVTLLMPYRPPRRSELATNRRTKPQYHGDWPAISRAAIAQHRAEHGDTCPGWGTPPHLIAEHEWTCDHDIGPLCRNCNSRKGSTDDKRRRT